MHPPDDFAPLPDHELDTIHGGVKLSVLGYPIGTIGSEGSSLSILGGQGLSNGYSGHLLQVTSGEAGQAGSHQFTLGGASATATNGLGALGITAGSWTHTGENGSVGVSLGSAEVRGADGYRPGMDVGGGVKLEGSLLGMTWSDTGGGNSGRLDVGRGEIGALAHQNEMFAGGGVKLLAGEHISNGLGAGYSVGLHMGLGVQVPELSNGAYRAEAQLGVIGVTGIITPERLQQGVNQMMEASPTASAQPAAPGGEAPAPAPGGGGSGRGAGW